MKKRERDILPRPGVTEGPKVLSSCVNPITDSLQGTRWLVPQVYMTPDASKMRIFFLMLEDLQLH